MSETVYVARLQVLPHLLVFTLIAAFASSCGLLTEEMQKTDLIGALTPPGDFDITGVTKGSGSLSNQWLGSNSPAVSWELAENAVKYTLSVHKISDDSEVCFVESTINSSLLTGCQFEEGAAYKIFLTAVSASGKETPASNNGMTVTYDNSVPAATLGSTPNSHSNSADAVFSFTATDSTSGVDRFECQKDGESFSLCASPKSILSLADGPHTFSVRAYDRAGNASTLLTYSWTVKTVPPGAFSITGVTGGADVAADAFLTSGANPTVNWSASSGTDFYDVTVFENDGTTVKCASVAVAAPALTVNFSTCSLIEGETYQVTVVARDLATNMTTATGSPFSFMRDTVAPVTPAFLQPGSATTVSGSSYNFKWVSSDVASGLRTTNTYQVQGYTQALCAGTPSFSSFQTSTTYTFGSLTNGSTYSVKVTSYDSAGNASTSACSPAVTVDSSAATLALTNATTSSTDYTKDATVDVAITQDASAVMWCLSETQTTRPTGVGAGTCAGGAGPSFGWYTVKPTTFALSGTEGLKTVYLWTADVGNTVSASMVTDSIQLDQTQPTVFTVKGASGGTDTTDDALLGTTTILTAKWNASTDAATAPVSYAVSVRNNADTADVCAAQATSSTSYTFSSCALSDGTAYKIKVVAYDQAQNSRTAALYSFTVDTTPPAAFSITGITGSDDTRNDAALTSGTTATLTWGASASLHEYRATLFADDGTTVKCAEVVKSNATTSHTFSSCVSSLVEGTYYKAKVVAIDDAGNSTSASNSLYRFRVNTLASSTLSSITGTSPVVADGTDASTVTITVLNSDSVPLENSVPTFSATNTGTHNTITACSATDSSGQSTCTLKSTFAETKTLSIVTPVNKSGGTVVFNAGAAHHLSFSQSPSSSGVAGQVLSQQPKVSVLDVNNNLVVASTDAITLTPFTSSDCTTTVATGTFAPVAALTVTSGVAAFTTVSYTKAETIYLKATSGALTFACTGAVAISHAAADHLVYSTQPPETKVNVAMSPQPVVEIQDVYNNRVTTGADATATVALTLSSGTGTLSGTASKSAVAGVADFATQGLNIDQLGTKQLRATKSSTTGTGGVGVLTVDSNSFLIIPITCDSGTLASTCVITANQSVSNGITITGTNLTIKNGATLSNTNNAQSIAFNLSGRLTIENGGTLQANVDSLQAAEVDIQSGGTFTAASLGYLGGKRTGNNSNTGQGAGGGLYVSNYGSGGGHCGAGGNGGAAGSDGGVVNDSNSNPIDYGSGGGGYDATNAPGGNGGGLVRIVATSWVKVDGTLNVDGGNGINFSTRITGAGSGGSVYISAPLVNGAGTVSANGGKGILGGGGGGGGCVAIITNKPFSGTVTAYAGLATRAKALTTTAANGSFYQPLSDPNSICDTGDLTTLCTINTAKTLAAGYTITANNLTIAAAGSIKTPHLFDHIYIALTGAYIQAGTVSADIGKLSATSVTLQSTAVIIGNIGGPDAVTKPGMTAPDITLTSGAVIKADGRGQPGAGSRGSNGGVAGGVGAGPSANSGNQGAGGSFGGVGGRSVNGGTLGATYGDQDDPTDYGSGGGGFDSTYGGGFGGGLIRIQATNSLDLRATLSANGGDGANGGPFVGGGGSGGTISIESKTLSGNGTLKSNGGMGYAAGGSGGGGRIRVKADQAFAGTVQAQGGPQSQMSIDAGAGTNGTYRMILPSAAAICDSGDLATTCTISTRKVIHSGYTITANNLSIALTGSLVTPHEFEPITINLTGDLDVLGRIDSDIRYLTAVNVTLVNDGAGHGGVIVGNIGGPDPVADPGMVATSFSLQFGTSLDASARGYRGGGKPGTISGYGAGPGGGLRTAGQANSGGGGHGGAGGNASANGIGGAAQGTSTTPLNYGSGGATGNYFGTNNGGGIINITVSTLDLNAVSSISANGGSGTGGGSYCGGGGSGGFIQINTGTITGSGGIKANGGNGATVGVTCNAGSGGGGKIVIARTAGAAYDNTQLFVLPGTATAPAGAGASGTTYQSP